MMVVETALGRIGIVHASGFANDARSWDVVWEDAQGLSARETEGKLPADSSHEHVLLWRTRPASATRTARLDGPKRV